MIKRLSYIFFLFVSLFVIVNVKALECSYDTGEKYYFDSEGKISSYSATKAKYYGTYQSPHSGNSTAIVSIEGPYKAEIKHYQEQPVEHVLNQIEIPIKPDTCPAKDEISATINQDNECTVTISRVYYCKHNLTNCYSDSFVGCTDPKLQTYKNCTNNGSFACIWVDRETGNVLTDGTKDYASAYCNVDNLQYVQCKNTFDIPVYLPRIISFVINFLKIMTPIVLIFTSALTLLNAITASKEDEMTKAKKTLFRRIAISVFIFFTITITQFVVEKVAEKGEADEFKSCLSCFINNNCSTTKYYKNNIGGEYHCYYASNSKEFIDQSKCH